jgi:hypothetical protein
MSDAALHAQRLRADLLEFENSFEVARADLEARVSSTVDNLEPLDLFEETEDGKRRLDREALAALLDSLDGVPRAVADAFEDFNWRIARELRELKRALQP